MKYDDASWHYGGDFPTDLPPQAAATHIAMFVSWAVLNGLAGDLHTNDFATDLAQLKSKTITPTEWFLKVCDEKFTDEDLNDEGNLFSQKYYNHESASPRAHVYFEDYAAAFPEVDIVYAVPDNWQTYDTIAAIISKRFKAWLTGNR